jgi:hypothetical protein
MDNKLPIMPAYLDRLAGWVEEDAQELSDRMRSIAQKIRQPELALKVDPLLPLRPMSGKKVSPPPTGLEMLEKKGHERLMVPGTVDLEKFPALDKLLTSGEGKAE